MENDETLITTKEFADLLRVAPITPAIWRCRGRGPSYIKHGNVVRYRLGDVRAWMASISVNPSAKDSAAEKVTTDDRAA